MTNDIRNAAQILWDYHNLRDKPEDADIIWALGSHDLRVADRAAELWQEGLAPLIVMSGGLGNFTKGIFEKPEAELFADRVMKSGVPGDSILIENKSSNTGENVTFTRSLLNENSLSVKSAIAVHKPYMERRTLATIEAQWPELAIQVTSPRLSLTDYCIAEIPMDMVIHIMVGDLQRIIEYPKRGFMTAQFVPQNVLDAMQVLVDAGFDAHLLA